MFTKKFILIVSVAVSLSLLLFGHVVSSGAADSLWPFISKVWVSLWPVWPLTFFSLITYFMRDEVFNAWKKFSLVWIPLSFLLILISDNGSGGWGITSFSNAAFFLVAMTFLYIIISILIIIGTYTLLWRRRQKKH